MDQWILLQSTGRQRAATTQPTRDKYATGLSGCCWPEQLPLPQGRLPCERTWGMLPDRSPGRVERVQANMRWLCSLWTEHPTRQRSAWEYVAVSKQMQGAATVHINHLPLHQRPAAHSPSGSLSSCGSRDCSSPLTRPSWPILHQAQHPEVGCSVGVSEVKKIGVVDESLQRVFAACLRCRMARVDSGLVPLVP